MELLKELKKSKEKIPLILNEIDIDSLETNGAFLKINDRMIKLSVVSNEPINEINIIKKEFSEKLQKQQEIIKVKITNEINELEKFYQSLKSEYDRKNKKLDEKIKNKEIMPKIEFSDSQKGLSITKTSNNNLCWLVQGIYWPKYVDGKKINAKYSKKMITPVIYMIETKDDIILNVSTRKTVGLDYFSHYHQSNPDCWGDWKYPKKWETPSDIINIARQAESVLENINVGSIAIRAPANLPKIGTIKKYLNDLDVVGNLNQTIRRQGLRSDIRENDDNVWST